VSGIYTPRTKIVCTLGPSTASDDTIRGLIEAGMNVARVNFSHGTHEQHAQTIAMVRRLAEESGKPIAILGDLQGPRIRIGDLAQPITLKVGDDLTLVHEGHERKNDIPVTYDQLAHDVHVGDRILVDDGLIELVVLEVNDGRVKARVLNGGPLKSHKGLNLPGIQVSAPTITEKDAADITFAVEQQVDYLALSFVRRAEDIEGLKRMIPKWLLVVAKIEKDVALHNIEAIVAASDAVMVARGDLGVEMPLEKVPGVQKQMTRACRVAGKPVVVATQMLESMISAPVPTRAEVSDVATAIFEGADAVMLSAESAAGQFPVQAVTTMNRIAEEVEGDPLYRNIITAQRAAPEATGADAIADAARHIADTLDLAAVICWTSSGSTGLRVARERPRPPIVALSPNIATGRRLAVAWGVHCVVTEDAQDQDDMVDRACRIAVKEGFAKVGQRVIVVAGVPFGTPGATNMLRIAYVGGDAAAD